MKNYNSTSSKDIIADAIERGLKKEDEIKLENDKPVSPTRDELIELLKADDLKKESGNTTTDANTGGNTLKHVYALSDNVKQLGYSAKVDNILIVVTPASGKEPAKVEMQDGFDPYDGKPVMVECESGMIENPSDEIVWQLVNAGVIVLNEDQKKAFNAKYFKIKS